MADRAACKFRYLVLAWSQELKDRSEESRPADPKYTACDSASVVLERRTDSAGFDVVASIACGGAAIRDVEGQISFEPDDTRYAVSRCLSLDAMLPGAKPLEFRVAERLHAQCFDLIQQNAFPMKVRVKFHYVDPQGKKQNYCQIHRYLGYSPFLAENCSR